VQEQVSI